MPKIICIDPGHGGADPGAVNGSRHESADNLSLALAVRDRLIAQGHTVVLTHTGNIPQTQKLALESRRLCAVNCKADLFVSLHRNSHEDKTAKGIEVWIRNTAHTQAASELLEQLSKEEHQSNRGVKIGAYAVLYNTPMPSMLLELGFISNVRDNDLYDRHFDANATAITKGILAALGEGYTQPGQPAKTPLYRVQIGAFGVKENAENFLRTVRDMGLEAFLVAPDQALAEVE